MGATDLSVRRARRSIVAVAVLFLALNVVVMTSTFGTNDILHWQDFLAGVRSAGPIGVYGVHFPRSLYNHAPLTGYFLVVVNWLSDRGVPFNDTIRLTSSLSDVPAALLVFELLRKRVPLRAATIAGFGVAASPILVIIAGFHGNTDPIFMMLVVLALWLLADRQAPLAAGIVLGLAVSIKVVPIVVVPVLIGYALRTSRRVTILLLAGLGSVFVLLWVPVLVTHFGAIRQNVLGYPGGLTPQWGLSSAANFVGGKSLVDVLTGPARLLIVALCALVPAWLVWRRPDQVVSAGALSMVAFLALIPSFGTQYLTWGLATAYLLDVWFATVYNVLGGVLLFVVYDRWAGGLPWDRAYYHDFTTSEKQLAVLVWVVLLGAIVFGVRRMTTRRALPVSVPAAVQA
ncbi:MAG TPA: glycosyltransferase 87 family protein [Jatrophihabitans sp.]